MCIRDRYQGEFREVGAKLVAKQVGRFITYLPWLFSQIIVANVQVAYYALHPQMPIAPGLLTFRTQMKKRISQVTLANSITLTPGTITASMEDGDYVVHVLKRSLAAGLEDGTIQHRVGTVYVEEQEPPPAARWLHSMEEIET